MLLNLRSTNKVIHPFLMAESAAATEKSLSVPSKDLTTDTKSASLVDQRS